MLTIKLLLDPWCILRSPPSAEPNTALVSSLNLNSFLDLSQWAEDIPELTPKNSTSSLNSVLPTNVDIPEVTCNFAVVVNPITLRLWPIFTVFSIPIPPSTVKHPVSLSTESVVSEILITS